MSYVPEINRVFLTSNDKFLILATDGVWDFLSDDEAVRLVGRCPDRSQAADILVQAALNTAAKDAGMSIEQLKSLPAGNKRRSLHDDTTVVVLYFDE